MRLSFRVQFKKCNCALGDVQDKETSYQPVIGDHHRRRRLQIRVGVGLKPWKGLAGGVKGEYLLGSSARDIYTFRRAVVNHISKELRIFFPLRNWPLPYEFSIQAEYLYTAI